MGVDDSRTAALWSAADRLLDGASLDGILAHKLGPLAAGRLRRLERPLPAPLPAEERAASLAMLTAAPLLERIRSSCDETLLLLKGPEVAHLYPTHGRRFGDIDILSSDAESTQRSLLAHGFVDAPDPTDILTEDHHHLDPVRWPTISLRVEVHDRPNWPGSGAPLSMDEMLERRVPTALGVDGVSAPAPAHHALLVAVHAWLHEPLQTLRDLLDVAAVSAETDVAEVERLANRTGVIRIWRTTWRAVEGLFYGGPRTVPLRVWRRHLEAVRARTVLDNHLQRWLSPYWSLPLPEALGEMGSVLRREVLPEPGETWTEKLGRIAGAARHPGSVGPDDERSGT